MVLRIEFSQNGKVVRTERFDLKVGALSVHTMLNAFRGFFIQMGWMK